VATSFAEYATDYPQPNWVEQNPHDWWKAVCDTSKRLISEAGISASEIAAVSFSGHMMGMTPVDKAGNPLRSCIIWADQRAQPQAEAIIDLLGADEVYRKTGHRASAAYSMAKLMGCPISPNMRRPIVCSSPKTTASSNSPAAGLTTDASGVSVFDLVSRLMTEQMKSWTRPSQVAGIETIQRWWARSANGA
jgi:xylulokinase